MTPPLARVFIGSSSEGLPVAKDLDIELGNACKVVRWDQNVFEPSGYTLESLVLTAKTVDFAVLIAAPDDTTIVRDESHPTPRDNIVLEFGLFAGALGRKRTMLLATGPLKLPTDVLGLTRLAYREHSTGRGAVTEAAAQITALIEREGLHDQNRSSSGVPNGGLTALDRELEVLCANAVAQGWTVKTNSATTLRLLTPKGKTHTLTKRQPEVTRKRLREFVARLRSAGLRVNESLRVPVEDSPY